MPGIFVTGTDTGIGKTYCSCLLLRKLQQENYTAVGMKPVASGATETKAGLRNEDALLLQGASSISLPYKEINPYVFSSPIAPHIAAKDAGIIIKCDLIKACYKKLQQQADWVVVEGVGGWQVPINATQTMADVATLLGLPVILVVGMRLGCLNHTLLTAQCIRASGLQIAGWLANPVKKIFPRVEENVSFLTQYLDAPCLGILDWEERPTAEENLQKISLKSLFA